MTLKNSFTLSHYFSATFLISSGNERAEVSKQSFITCPGLASSWYSRVSPQRQLHPSLWHLPRLLISHIHLPHTFLLLSYPFPPLSPGSPLSTPSVLSLEFLALYFIFFPPHSLLLPPDSSFSTHLFYPFFPFTHDSGRVLSFFLLFLPSFFIPLPSPFLSFFLLFPPPCFLFSPPFLPQNYLILKYLLRGKSQSHPDH